MNPRVSRSSALASKATGFPIAKVAAKLAVGYTLDEIANDITGGATPASFEPTIDYVVTKIPRFAFEKFPGAEPMLTTSMKSVGEAMAIGRTFQESLQKALRSLETGLTGLDEIAIEGFDGQGHRRQETRDPRRARHADARPPAQGRAGDAARLSDRRAIHDACTIDPWFLAQIRGIVETEAEIRAKGLPATRRRVAPPQGDGLFRRAARQAHRHRRRGGHGERRALGVRPVFKRIDTCAAEFASPTAYMYSTYETPFAGSAARRGAPSDKKKIIILGGGPNRIGQGIEFDYCCCHACFALNEAGYETIMVNCNPETVSTDYDTSDRLYFEPLTAEDVLEIIDTERSNGTLHGVIVQFGGQTPLKLAEALETGQRADPRHLARRDRPRRGPRPLQAAARQAQAAPAAERHRHLARRRRARSPSEIGYPGRDPARPTCSAAAPWRSSRDAAQLERYIARLAGDLDRPSELVVSTKRPLLIDRYLSDAIEVDVDCLADGKDTFIAGIMEHIEEAGIHSGDSRLRAAAALARRKTTIAELERQTRALALALNVGGLMNVQYAIKDGDIYVLEVNPRASRTVPFVAKVIGLPVAKIAARVMAGESARQLQARSRATSSTSRGEGSGVPVRALPRRRHRARAGDELDRRGDGPRPRLRDRLRQEPDRRRHQPAAQRHGVRLGAGRRQAAHPGGGQAAGHARLQDHRHLGHPALSGGARASTAGKINKVLEGRPHIVDAIKNGEVQLVFNTTEGATALADSRSLRRAALLHKVPYYTTLSGAVAAAQGIKAYLGGDLEVRALQSYFGGQA